MMSGCGKIELITLGNLLIVVSLALLLMLLTHFFQESSISFSVVFLIYFTQQSQEPCSHETIVPKLKRRAKRD